ncbi:MAG: ATPase P [Deltaproteobacteria bacterium]|nr:MAG: ATPase P [Deltaproteobacteria bacterium]
MIEIKIPGFKKIKISNIILDYNGTLAVDGSPVEGIKERIEALSKMVNIHVITADTNNSVSKHLKNYPCNIKIISGDKQDIKKRDYIRTLGAESSAAFGNGRNDILMIEEAAVGVAVILDEGCFSSVVLKSDIVVKSINSGLDLFLKTNRLIAGFRNA